MPRAKKAQASSSRAAKNSGSCQADTAQRVVIPASSPLSTAPNTPLSDGREPQAERRGLSPTDERQSHVARGAESSTAEARTPRPFHTGKRKRGVDNSPSPCSPSALKNSQTAEARSTTTTQATPRKYVVPPAFSRETTADSDIPAASSSTTAINSSLTAVSDRLASERGAFDHGAEDAEEEDDDDGIEDFVFTQLEVKAASKTAAGRKGQEKWRKTDMSGYAAFAVLHPCFLLLICAASRREMSAWSKQVEVEGSITWLCC